MQQISALVKALWQQRAWLLFAVPFALACWKPMQNSSRNWGNPNSVLMFQSLVPFAAALLVWQQRAYLQALWGKIQALPENDRRRHGNMILAVLGCMMVLFGHLVYVDSFFGIGLLLIFVGTIYYVYGGVILRAIAGPISLLILMVNPPDSLLSRTTTAAISGTALATSSFLSLLGRASSISLNNDKESIHFLSPDYYVDITDPLNGANILIALLFVTFICAWYQRRTPLYTFCFLVLTSVLVIFVHLMRVSVYALTTTKSPAIATLLIGFNPWLLILVLGATIIYASQSADLFSLRMKVAAKQREKYGIQKKGVSSTIEKKLLNPIFNASDKGILYLSQQNRKFSKNVNAFFKKLMPASKKKNRNRW